MVQYPRPYGFTRLYASRSEDLTITSLTQTCFNPAQPSTPRGVCVFVKSKLKDLVPPEFLLDDYVLKYVVKEKYLGFIMSNDCKSDLDINRQMRSIYGRGNIIISSFKHCTVNVKIQLFKTFCCNFYGDHLWHSFKKRSYGKIKIAFKKIYRYLMNLDRYASITSHMVNLNIDYFDVLLRKSIYTTSKSVCFIQKMLLLVLLLILCYVLIVHYTLGGIKLFIHNFPSHIYRCSDC